VEQYRFQGPAGDSQWVFYWHYTLPPPDNSELHPWQRIYQRLRHRPSSITVEVFAPENSPSDVEFARQFVRLVDAALRAHVGPTAIRGSDRLQVTVVEPEVAARRTSERSGMPVGQVLERIQKAQMASEERIRRSDVVIDTSGTLEDTRRRTFDAWDRLEHRLSAEGWGKDG